VLTRGPYSAPWQTVHWDAEQEGPWTETLEGADACINLAGRSVNCRYDGANRKAIYESRLVSTRLLGNVIAGLNEPPRVWLNASAATIYKRALDEDGVDLPVDEATSELGADEPSGVVEGSAERWAQRRGFSARVARDWEAAFFAAETPRTRKVALRSAVTFSPAPGNVFAAVRLLLKETKTGSVAAPVERLAGELGKSVEELLSALTSSGLRVPEKPREKPVFVEHAGEIFWLNRNAKDELWLNAKASKFAAARSEGHEGDAHPDEKSHRSRGRRRGPAEADGDKPATAASEPPGSVPP